MRDRLPKDSDDHPIGSLIELEYDVCDLPARDFHKLLGGPELRLALGILKKMIEGDGEDFVEAILPLNEITDELQQVELTKELFHFVAKAMEAHNRRFDDAAVDRAMETIYKENADKMSKTIFDKKFDEGVAVGEVRGKAEGIAEGEKNMLLKVLQAKFHKVPKKIENTIRAMTDTIALESLAVHVTNCDSLDEFAKTLK